MSINLILGSSSVYRQELLNRLRLPYAIDVPDIDETPRSGETPDRTALRLAEAKARAVGARHPHALVIGSDQVAMLGDLQLGKPGTRDRAVAQLKMMQGRTVVFHTALCLLNTVTGRTQTVDVPTTIRFRSLSDAQLARYVDLDEPLFCAGSAKIESLGIALIEQMTSDDPTAIIGLPLIALTTLLAAEGVHVL